MERGLAGWVFENRQAVIISSSGDDPRWLKRTWDYEQNLTRSAISVPLMDNDQIMGILTLVNSGADRFTEDDFSLLTVLSVFIS